MLTKAMLDESKGLQEMAKVARSSSTRAYAGHSAEFRHIFDIKNLNLTEYARSFGIYKVVHENMTKSKWIDHRDTKKLEQRANQVVDANEGVATELFTKRLQKSKLKDLERELREAQKTSNSANEVAKIKSKMIETKKAVFTDERKLEQRKQGFDRAKNNVKATTLSEFMWHLI